MAAKGKPGKSKPKKPAHKHAKKREAGTWAFTLRCTVEEMTDPVWRVLRVPSNISLHHLHHVLQAAMEWQDCHLHLFMAGKREYAPRYAEVEGALDSAQCSLAEVLPGVGTAITYNYDFGDDWMVEVRLEAEEPPGKGPVGIELLDAGGVAPVEDSGGPWGFEEQVAAFRDPKHPDHQETVDWLGEDFDPDNLDMEQLRADVAACTGPYDSSEIPDDDDVYDDDEDDFGGDEPWDGPADPMEGIDEEEAEDIRVRLDAGAWIAAAMADIPSVDGGNAAGFAMVAGWHEDDLSVLGMAIQTEGQQAEELLCAALQMAKNLTRTKPSELLVHDNAIAAIARGRATALDGVPVSVCPEVLRIVTNLLAIASGSLAEGEEIEPNFRLPIPGVNGADESLTRRYLAATSSLHHADFSKVLPHPVGFRMSFTDEEALVLPMVNPKGQILGVMVCSDEDSLRACCAGLAQIEAGTLPENPPHMRLFMLFVGVDEVADDQVADIDEAIPGVFKDPSVAVLSLNLPEFTPVVPAEEFELIVLIAQVLLVLAEPGDSLACHLPPRDGDRVYRHRSGRGRTADAGCAGGAHRVAAPNFPLIAARRERFKLCGVAGEVEERFGTTWPRSNWSRSWDRRNRAHWSAWRSAATSPRWSACGPTFSERRAPSAS